MNPRIKRPSFRFRHEIWIDDNIGRLLGQYRCLHWAEIDDASLDVDQLAQATLLLPGGWCDKTDLVVMPSEVNQVCSLRQAIVTMADAKRDFDGARSSLLNPSTR